MELVKIEIPKLKQDTQVLDYVLKFDNINEPIIEFTNDNEIIL